ncbi:peptide chain release factor N(5)-glutamine methyltransferase [Anaplasmataceae bacterium AB001_6]|nr:peptide chain release factor N(5)-glutamine methyltransferase [Anaplasmataceae bacterium AB001_6]
MKIFDLHIAGTKLLSDYVDNAALESEILLMHVLHMTQSEIIINSDKIVEESIKEHFFSLVQRRITREPIAYIIGVKEFYGREFNVLKEVLIPRPETELLIDTAKEFITPDEKMYFADFGAGTGCICITILLEFSSATAKAFDIFPLAIENTLNNLQKYNLFHRAKIIENSWHNTSEKFDYIFCNPPYIPSGDIITLADDIYKHESHIALDGGKSGLEHYMKMVPIMKKCLHKKAFLELGYNQYEALHNLFTEAGLSVDYRKDLNNIKRVMIIENKKNEVQ